ncbi:autophagy protein 5, partial [Tieghemiomyces parasiticus]
MPKLPTDEDRFRKLVWHGKLPIQISLAKEDRAALLGRASPSSPPVYYVMAHRCSYLSLITDDVKAWLEALERAAPDRPSFIKPTQVWYAFNGAPLKWHYPIGLLYDLHSIRHPPGTVSAKPICTTKLPWTITVHLTNFPADRLLRNPSRDTTHHYFMAQYKEAEFMRTGSTKRVMNLPREDQDRLWAGLTTAEFETFWAVNHGAVNADDKDDLPRHVAIRLYSRTDSAVVQVPLPLAEL